MTDTPTATPFKQHLHDLHAQARRHAAQAIDKVDAISDLLSLVADVEAHTTNPGTIQDGDDLEDRIAGDTVTQARVAALASRIYPEEIQP